MATTEVYTMPRVGKELMTLGFSFQGLRSIPEEVFQKQGVEALWLGGNNLQDLPEKLSTLQQLMYLDLASNDFCECPDVVYAFQNLIGLYLTGNQLRCLSSKVGNLHKLQSLWLDNNDFAAFPHELCDGGLRELEHLRLNKNRITQIPLTISNLPALKILELNNNQIGEVPSSVCELTNLQALSLKFNNIQHLPRNLGCLKELKSLEVSNNRLEEIPLSACNLKQLCALHLSSNKLSILPTQLATQLEELESITLENNPLIQPPYGICLQGVAAIRSYEAESNIGGNVLEPRQKVVVLGKTCAGKTSLVKTILLDRSFLADVVEGRTHCIEVGEWSPGNGVRFEIYDFGGHPVYNITSHFFLSPHSLNIVVVNLKTYTSEDYDETVGKWLHTLQARVPGAVVCVVGTHTDQCSQQEIETKVADISRQIANGSELNLELIISQLSSLEDAIHSYGKLPLSHRLYGVSLQSLQQRHDQLKDLRDKQLKMESGVHLVSSAETMQGISQLKAHLVQLVDNRQWFPGLHRRLPPSWVEMEREILQQRKPFKYMITFEECLEIGKTCNLREEDVPLVISYLHQQGTVLYFHDNPQLRSYIFPDPVLIIDIFKDIFHHEPTKMLSHSIPAMRATFTRVRFQKMQKNFLNEGLVPQELLEVLLRNRFKNASDMQIIITLMQKLGLYYEVQSKVDGLVREKAVYRLPLYLKSERPDVSKVWPDSTPKEAEQITVGLEMHKFCPAGIFERLCAKIQPHPQYDISTRLARRRLRLHLGRKCTPTINEAVSRRFHQHHSCRKSGVFKADIGVERHHFCPARIEKYSPRVARCYL
ncbi:malignant fibrous histiocytoma-amplified sequence 1 homolog [Ptychodera flava]|uniref:malignant fibrous histiocytoma-amplified sequence 1 homolog n=1 Tax=Ptychodera flava TaxID=63121 RepID=UPI00396A1B99